MGNLNVVHESEAQRQYARVKIPFFLTFFDSDRDGIQVLDLSAGGFSINTATKQHSVGNSYRGKMLCKLDGFDFSIDVSFVCRSINKSENRVGFEFQDLGPREVSAFRYLITSHLSGELVSLGDMMNIISRENHTKKRKVKLSPQSRNERIRAVAGSMAFLMIGVMAAIYVAGNVYEKFFVTQSKSAHLVAEQHSIAIPSDGYVDYLVEPGQAVQAGESIATYQAPLISYLSNKLKGEMNLEALTDISSQSISGTIVSPCNCIVTKLLGDRSTFLTKGDDVAVLRASNKAPFVEAVFEFAAADSIVPGDSVTIVIPGKPGSHQGVIDELHVITNSYGDIPSGLFKVRISLQDTLPEAYVGRPMRVSKSVSIPFISNSFVESA